MNKVPRSRANFHTVQCQVLPPTVTMDSMHLSSRSNPILSLFLEGFQIEYLAHYSCERLRKCLTAMLRAAPLGANLPHFIVCYLRIILRESINSFRLPHYEPVRCLPSSPKELLWIYVSGKSREVINSCLKRRAIWEFASRYQPILITHYRITVPDKDIENRHSNVSLAQSSVPKVLLWIRAEHFAGR